MSRTAKFFSLLVLLGLLLFPIRASAVSEQSINVLDDQVFFALGPTSEEIDQALADNFTEWANYEQDVRWDTEPAKLGEIVREASFQEKFALNSAVTLITLGESLEWQLPSDSDLFLQSLTISERLNHLWFEWTNPENDYIRIRYPEISNGATYALYAFFDYDEERLQAWQETYHGLFGDNLPQLFPNTFLQSNATTLEPFLVRPFYNPNSSFYTVNSFFDHQYPRYEGEGDAYNDTLYRFDGSVLENAAFNPCDQYIGITCYSGHDAYDYNTPLGWPIRAAASGTVIDVRQDSGTVLIEHDNGLLTVYMHLNAIYVNTTDNANVQQEEVIGEAGNRGTGGVHLHFGVRYPDNLEKDIDPFGWWSTDLDPWSEYPTLGQESTWLWKGDEAGDGYLTVDNQESQAQLFLNPETTPPAPPAIGWHRLLGGYQNEAWYSFMNQNTDTSAYWGIWGTTIDQPGEYVVQAYWPNDPDPNDEWQPASNARYKFYFHENGELREVILYANQTLGANQFNPLCKVPHPEGNCPEEQIARFSLDHGATSVILSNAAGYDTTQHQKILFFDAVEWKTAPPISTPTATLLPGQTVGILINQGSDDGGTNPGDCAFYNTDNEVYLGACFGGGDITSGFRFQNVQIPRYANIESAYLNFTVDGTYITSIQVQIYGEASSAPLTYTVSGPPSNRLTTFNSAIWNITNIWELGEQYNTPDISPIIQEIVNRPDWNAGQPISIVIKNAGSTNVRRVIAFERASFDPNLNPAQLAVTYNLNPTPTPTATLPNSTPQPTNPPTLIPPTYTHIPPTIAPTNPPVEVPKWCKICGSGCPSNSAQRLTANGTGLYGTPTPYSTTPTPASSSLRIAETVDLTTLLYRVRDEILSATPEGQRLTDLYYSYIPNIVQVLMANPELSDQSLETMNLFAPSLQALLDGNGDTVTVTSEQVTGLQSFLNALVEQGDPELQAIILAELERRPLENMVGMTMDEAWSYTNGYQLEWLPPISNSNPYSANQGSAIPVKFTVTDFEGNFVIDESLTLQVLDVNGDVVVGPIQVSSNPNNGIKIQGSQYHYNLMTKDLPVGSYTLQVIYNSSNGTRSETRSIILAKKK